MNQLTQLTCPHPNCRKSLVPVRCISNPAIAAPRHGDYGLCPWCGTCIVVTLTGDLRIMTVRELMMLPPMDQARFADEWARVRQDVSRCEINAAVAKSD